MEDFYEFCFESPYSVYNVLYFKELPEIRVLKGYYIAGLMSVFDEKEYSIKSIEWDSDNDGWPTLRVRLLYFWGTGHSDLNTWDWNVESVRTIPISTSPSIEKYLTHENPTIRKLVKGF